MTDVPRYPLFDAERMRVYPRILVALYTAVAIGIFLWSKNGLDAWGKPLGYDFITFWSASYLSLKGQAAAAFDAKQIFLAQRAATPGETIFLWHYPPTFQLLGAPLSLLPYFASYLLFIGATLTAFVATTRRLLDDPQAVWLLLASPAVYICVLHGQNSFLSAALFAGAILLIDRRPVLAGVCLGFLAYKPQLGLLLPLALAISGQWRVFFSTAATALVFAGVSTLVFGVDLWFVFFKDGAVVRQILENGFLPWEKIPSAFIFLRLLGVPQTIAYGAQILTALSVTGIVAVVWRTFGATRLSFAVLITATMLVPPYIFDYEFAILMVPLAIVASDMIARGATRPEKTALLVLYIIPIQIAPVAAAIHLQIGFLALLATLWLAVHRAYLAAPVPKATPCFSTPNQASAASTTATAPATDASARL
ncbi:MAG TPA: glycosyltransferase family 87 protein [Parvibaculum sp.]